MPEPVGLGAAGELGWRLPKCWSGTDKSWARTSELAAAKKTSYLIIAKEEWGGDSGERAFQELL